MSDAIGKIREELAGVEQQQAQALTAAEVERSRGLLFGQQQVQESAELEELVRSQSQVSETLQTIEASLRSVEEDMTLRVQTLEELEQELMRLVGQRAAAVAEEERGRKDVLQLAVLVANTEQAISQLARRMEDLVGRGARLTAEREELGGQRAVAIDRHESLRKEYGEADRRVSELREELRAVQEEAAQAVGGMQSLDQVILRRSEELAGVDSRLEALQGVVREEMGYGRQGEHQGPALKSCEGVRDAVAEWLVVPSGMERAVEAVLGERVRGWFVDEPSVGKRLIRFLQQEALGRGTFIPQHPRWERATTPSWWPMIAAEPGVVGRAVELVQTDAARTAARDVLFDRVVIIRSLDQALQLWAGQEWGAPDGPILVTLDGEVVDASGIVTGGQVQSTPGLLERRREVIDLEAKRQSFVAELDQSKQQRDILFAQIQLLTQRDRQLSDALREAEMQNLSLRKDEEQLQHVLADLDQRVQAVDAEIHEGLSARESVEEESQSVQAQLGQWIAEKNGQDALVAGVRERLGVLDQTMNRHQEHVTQAKLAVEGLRGKREHEQLNRARVMQQIQEAEERRRALGEHLNSLKGLIEQSREEQVRQETLCQDFGVTAGRVKGELVAAQEQQAQHMATSHTLEAGLEEVRRGMSTVRDARMTVEVRRAEVRMQLGTVEGTLAGTYQIDSLTLVAVPPQSDGSAGETDVAAQQETDERSEVELKEQLQKLRDRLDRMGPINLAAISEHQELEERHTFLSAQEQDLSNSIASLKEIIQRINLTTKEMFAATYDELQQKFTEVFGQFFPGGRAELQLIEESPLENGESLGNQEPGIEIVAQPPGKRLKSITMLSGGEKTLTAMALLFASFLIRPTPFCLLDEIDAPLDEENIGRFTAVLKDLAQNAQFLVITHNKRTMSIADSLFGVTMEEPGVSKLVSVRLGDLQPA